MYRILPSNTAICLCLPISDARMGEGDRLEAVISVWRQLRINEYCASAPASSPWQDNEP